MKILIAFLLVLGAYCECADDEFRMGSACISCAESPCEKCKGTDRCEKCPDGIEHSTYGQCDTCKNIEQLPVNKVCKFCSEIGAIPDLGMGCACSGTTNCCEGDGVYGWKLGDLEYYCSPCSYDVMGCGKCSYVDDTDKFVCSECIEGYEKDGEDDKAACISYSGHLFVIVGLLISLLTLA